MQQHVIRTAKFFQSVLYANLAITTCLIFAYLLHSINPVWVALRSVPLGMSATLSSY